MCKHSVGRTTETGRARGLSKDDMNKLVTVLLIVHSERVQHHTALTSRPLSSSSAKQTCVKGRPPFSRASSNTLKSHWYRDCRRK